VPANHPEVTAGLCIPVYKNAHHMYNKHAQPNYRAINETLTLRRTSKFLTQESLFHHGYSHFRKQMSYRNTNFTPSFREHSIFAHTVRVRWRHLGQ
jgi:hypothetical protein